jgi:hypothetical protein
MSTQFVLPSARSFSHDAAEVELLRDYIPEAVLDELCEQHGGHLARRPLRIKPAKRGERRKPFNGPLLMVPSRLKSERHGLTSARPLAELLARLSTGQILGLDASASSRLSAKERHVRGDLIERDLRRLYAAIVLTIDVVQQDASFVEASYTLAVAFSRS